MTSTAAAQVAPVAMPDTYAVGTGDTLVVGSAGVLFNDVPAPGDSLSALVETAPMHGEVKLMPDGSFHYVPDLGFVGLDSFSYRAFVQTTEYFVVDSLRSEATLDARVSTQLGSDSDSDESALRGMIAVDLLPNQPPHAFARVSDITLALADPMQLEFRFGGIVSLGGLDVLSDPDSLVLTLPEPGPAAPVAEAEFEQHDNRVRIEGTVNLDGKGLLESLVPQGPQAIELDTVVAIPGLLAEVDTLVELQIPILFEDVTDIEGVGVEFTFEGVLFAAGTTHPDVASAPATVTIQVDPVATALDAETPPHGARLAAPYPNPFDARASLAFSLDRPAEVALTLYDVQGREVARLADGVFAAGVHRADVDGGVLAAGVYLIVLDVDGARSTRTLVRRNGR